MNNNFDPKNRQVTLALLILIEPISDQLSHASCIGHLFQGLLNQLDLSDLPTLVKERIHWAVDT